MLKKKTRIGKKVLVLTCCAGGVVIGGLLVANKVFCNQQAVVKVEEDNKTKRLFQKEEEVDGIYSGLFNMPLKPIKNSEFTGEAKEVYEKLQPFAEKYSDPKWSTIPEAKYDYTFPTVAKANEFLGFDKILHPLENEEKVCVELFGGNTGAIHAAYINTEYTLDGQKVKIANIIATEYSQYPTGALGSCGHTEMLSHLVSLFAGIDGTGDYTIEIMSDKDFSYNQSFYSCGDLDVTVLETKQDNLVIVEVYFVIDGILYVAGMEVPQEQVANANTTLKEIVQNYVKQM